MDRDKPLVSVLMTAYNREKYIAAAIESVLSSTYTNFELIIVDDGSKDKTVEIAKGYTTDARVQLYQNEKNLGDYPNRNKAASYATGTYLKYLDSDDVMYSYTLQILVAFMEQFPDAALGMSSIPVHQPYPVLLSPKDTYLEHFYTYGHFNRAPGSVIIRKAIFDKVGGFTGERMIGDTQLWFTIAREHAIVKVPRDLVWNREHPDQESKSDYAALYEQLTSKVIQEAFNHPNCPLSAEEQAKVFKFLKWSKKKSVAQSFFKKMFP